ncbi:MAG: hypothetical protein WBA88_13025 [Pseudaminobacter sp.]
MTSARDVIDFHSHHAGAKWAPSAPRGATPAWHERFAGAHIDAAFGQAGLDRDDAALVAGGNIRRLFDLRPAAPEERA